MIKRDNVKSRQQHAIICAHGCDELVLRSCREQRIDQRIKRRRGGSGEIERSFLLRARRSPAHALLIAGRGRGRPLADHHVEIEFLPPALILNLVDKTHQSLDANALQRGGVIKRESLLIAILHHDLESDRNSVLRQRIAVDMVAGVGEQGERAPRHLRGRGRSRH